MLMRTFVFCKPGAGDRNCVKVNCSSGHCVCVSVCVFFSCVQSSDLQHLLVDAIMAVGAEVGLVLIFPEFRNAAQVPSFARFCIKHQTLSQQPAKAQDRDAFNVLYEDVGLKTVATEQKAHTTFMQDIGLNGGEGRHSSF